MAFSKIILNDNTLIDVTDTTATASDVAQGKYFYTNAGVRTEGTATGGGGGAIVQDENGYLVLSPDGGGGKFDYFDMAQPSGALESLTATAIKPYFFAGRTGITSINVPNLGYLEASMCEGCTGLQTVNFGGARWRNYNGTNFKGCTSLVGFVQKVTESAWGTPSGSIFEGCTSLQYLDLNLTGTNAQNGFNGCTVLTKIVLRKSSGVVSLANTNWFTGTPFASDGSGGILYVPQALISDYQSATNWSTILGYANNQIKSIESTATDPTAPIDLTTHYADGTLI